jgi:hypothetical protein
MGYCKCTLKNEYEHLMTAWERTGYARCSGGFGDTQGLEDRGVQLQGNGALARLHAMLRLSMQFPYSYIASEIYSYTRPP